MHLVKQILILAGITVLAEVCYYLIDLPIPASIYGLLMLLIGLQTKLIRLEWVKDVGQFLLDLMPIMFIPAAVGIMGIWQDLTHIIIPLILAIILTTLIVMAMTGRTVQQVIQWRRQPDDTL